MSWPRQTGWIFWILPSCVLDVFDRKIAVSRPDVKGREEILKVHAKNKPLGDDVDLHQIAQTTAGFTGADLENLLNEAAIYAAKGSRAYMIQEDIRKAFIKVGIGAEKKSRVISEKEKRITAYHESGHAILFHVFRTWGRYIQYPLFPPVWARQDIPCLFRRGTTCSIPKERCCRILSWTWADA